MNEQEGTIEKLLSELMEMSSTIVDLKDSIRQCKTEIESFQEREINYQTMLENIPQKIFLKNKILVYVFCNGNYARGLQRKPEEIIGKTDYDFFSPEIAEENAKIEKRIITSGKPEETFKEYLQEGQKNIVHKLTFPLKDEKGNVIGIASLEGEERKEHLEQLRGLFSVDNSELVSPKEQVQQEIDRRQKDEEAWQKKEEIAQRMMQENAIWAKMGEILVGEINTEEVYGRFRNEIGKIIPFDRITISLVNPQENTLKLVYAAGTEMVDRKMGDVFPLFDMGENEVIKARSFLILQKNHPEAVLGRFQMYLPFYKAGFQSVLLVPLFEGEKVTGILSLMSSKKNAYREEDGPLAQSFGILLAGAIHRTQLAGKCQQMVEKKDETEARLQSLIEFNPDAIFLLDLMGNIVNANPACSRITDYSIEELQQKSFINLATPGDLAKVKEHFERTLHGELQKYTLKIRLKDEREVEIDITHFPLMVHDKMEGVYMIAQGGIESSPIIKPPQGFLPEYEGMVEDAPLAIWVYLNGMLKFVNHKCTEILGYTREELVNKSLAEFLLSEDKKMMMDKYSALLMGKEGAHIFSFRFQHKEGYTKWLESKAVRILWEEKPAILNYVTDITDQKSSREAVRQSVEQIRSLINSIEGIFRIREYE